MAKGASHHPGTVRRDALKVLAAVVLAAGVSGPARGEADVTIGGQYRAMANTSNFGWHAGTITDDQATESFVNQRFRTWFNVKVEENVGGYLEIEAGHNTWGDQGNEFPKATTFEVRRAYLTYTEDELGEFQVGILPWSDAFGDVLASGDHDFNFGGVTYSKTFGEAVRFKLAALQIREKGESPPGTALPLPGNSGLYAGDLDFGKRVGLGVYYMDDRGGYSYGAHDPTDPLASDPSFGGPGAFYDVANGTEIWVGARARLGILDAFAIYNEGGVDTDGNGTNDWNHKGYAGKLGLLLPIGEEKAKLRLQALYSTGNDGTSATGSDEFRTIAQGMRDNFGAMGYWSMLGLTSPHGPSDVQDLGVSLQNRSLGLTTVQASLEVSVGESTGVYLAVGWLRSTENNANGEDDMGVEVLVECRHKLGEGLGLEVGAAYLDTGDFYKVNAGDPDPDDLFEVFARVQLEF